MPLAGWMLVQATGGTAMQALLWGGLFGAIGCTIGSIINYALGAWGGRPLIKRYGRWILVSEEDLDNADKWFKRYGDWAAFVSRLLPIVRTFISFPAGVTRMNFARFTVFSFLGSFIWCGLLALGGLLSWGELGAAARDHAALRHPHRPDHPGGRCLVRLQAHPEGPRHGRDSRARRNKLRACWQPRPGRLKRPGQKVRPARTCEPKPADGRSRPRQAQRRDRIETGGGGASYGRRLASPLRFW